MSAHHGPAWHKPPPGDGWIEVVFADQLPECSACGEPWCEKHQAHYHECSCPGPTQDDVYEYTELDGVMFAREIKKEG